MQHDCENDREDCSDEISREELKKRING